MAPDTPQPVEFPIVSLPVAEAVLDLIEEILGRSEVPSDWDRLQMMAKRLDDALHPGGRLEVFRRAIVEDSLSVGAAPGRAPAPEEAP